MAKKEDLDLDVEGGKKSSRLILILIILLALVLLGGGGAAAWYFFLRPAPVSATAPEGAATAPPVATKPRVDQGPPVYVELDPDFVVSFKDQRLARFMQLRVKLMSHDADLMETVEQYKPVLRNNLLLLYSSQKFEEIVTREGKEKLLAQSLEEVNRTLEKEAGVSGVEAVYFTSFVAQ